MIDARLQDGELVCDSAGRFLILGDRDARFQRALIAMTAKKGAFIYNRSLGADYDAISGADSADDVRRKTEQIFNEALADYADTSVTVTQTGEQTLVRIRVDGEERNGEVIRY